MDSATKTTRDLRPHSLRVEKPWGSEVIWAQTDAYVGRPLHVTAGRRLSLQYHDQKLESQCLVRGRAVLIIEDDAGALREVEMEPGKVAISPTSATASTPLRTPGIVEVSTPEQGTTFRVDDDYQRPNETPRARAAERRGWPSMSPPFDIVTFDCYGTLIDWGGAAATFAAEAARRGVALDTATALNAYAAAEAEVETEQYRPYHEVLAESARRAANRLGWAMTASEARFLPDSLPSWLPFADTNPALERMAAAGCALAILSNVDDDLIAATLRHLTVTFAFVITAQQVQSYKPAHGHFLEARRRIGDRRWLHAAQSAYHDLPRLQRAGRRSAWINRKGEASPAGVQAMPVP
ncbi:MAG: hypothetical protein U0531_19750 [Dehalococcoidia bacterium]